MKHKQLVLILMLKDMVQPQVVLILMQKVNKIIASGDTSFIHFKQTSASGIIGAYGDYSAILGGKILI